MPMPHCASGGCRQGRSPCPTPHLCDVLQLERRPLTFRPDFEVDGPFMPRTRGGRVAFALVALVALACLCAVLAPFAIFNP